MEPGLVVRGLAAAYGDRRVLDGVDLTVERGEVVGLIGPNGAGKTTLMSVVAGLRRPHSGSVHVLGIDALAHPRRARERIGLAGQDVAVYPTHTVAENLEFFGAIGGLRGTALQDSVAELLEALDLEELRGRPARELSGGQQRRLHAGCALVHRPELVLLDEPTAGADPETRLRLLHLVRRLADQGTTVLYTTHYLGELDELKARLVVLSRGLVLAEGEIAELIARHTSRELALRFSGPAPEVDWAGARQAGDTLFLPTADPAADVIAALEAVGPARDRLLGVELSRNDLDQAYLNLIAGEGDRCTAS